MLWGKYLGHLAVEHNLWLHLGVDEHPFATYCDVHQPFEFLFAC